MSTSAKLIPIRTICVKIGYSTEREAADAARKLHDRKVQPYKCPQCSLWHCGHGELGRRSRYKFFHNRAYLNRTYMDRLDQIFATLGL